MDLECKNCKSPNFVSETNQKQVFKNCCHFGTIKPVKSEYPESLKTLFFDNEFLKNIWSYNSTFSFASMRAHIQHFSHGPHFFKIHGQVYHNTYHASTNEQNNLKYEQLYVIDTNEATNIRMLK